MNLDQFIKKWTGKYCEVAGSANAKNQCVDLANAYIRDVLGLPIIEWTDAKDFPSKVSKNHYDWIPDAQMTVPQKGDLIIWKTNHIAICVYADVQLPWFTSFDQNWPTGSVCNKIDHNYSGVSGWLRPKGDNMTDCLLYNNDKDQKTFSNLVMKGSRYDEFIKIGFESAAAVTQRLQEMRDSIDQANNAKEVAETKAVKIRTDFNALVALVAKSIGTTQEITQIEAVLKDLEKTLEEHEDIKLSLGELTKEFGEEKEALNAEVARLKALLEQKDVLINVKMEDLLKEIVRRLVNILKRS